MSKAKWHTTKLTATLLDQKTGKRLASARMASNTFARSDEYDFEIYTEENIALEGTMAKSDQIDSILSRILSPTGEMAIESLQGIIIVKKSPLTAGDYR